MERIVINTQREGYSVGQIRDTMTVSDLLRFLEDFDEDTPVYLSFDNGYTYGRISEDQFTVEDGEEGEE